MSLWDRFYMTFIFEDRWHYFAEGTLMTIILTLLTFVIGTILAAAICGLRMSENKIIKKIIEVFNGFMVQIPTLVLLMIFLYLVFADTDISVTSICIIGLSMKNAAYLSDIFYTAICAVDKGEIEAARALGMSKTQAFVNVTLPQTVKNALSLYQNEFVTCLQETSIVGSLAVDDLTKMSSVITSRTLDALFCLICVSIIYIVMGYLGTAVISVLGKDKHLEVKP